MPNLKEAKTLQEQVAILEARNMLIDDEAKAMRVLRRINYYRFTGYAYQFLTGKEKYRKNISFNDILHIYRFDQELRNVFLKTIEEIEIFVKTRIAYYMGINISPAAHYDQNNFMNGSYHQELIDSLEREIERNRDLPFVAHHIREYKGKMPVWVAVELWSFSSISKLYSNLLISHKEAIAKDMGLDSAFLSNWLHCIAVLRNQCAHFGRLYNKDVSIQAKLSPKTLRSYPEINLSSLFSYVVIILRFLPEAELRDKFRDELIELVCRNEEYIELGLLGFPKDWKDLLYKADLISVNSKK